MRGFGNAHRHNFNSRQRLSPWIIVAICVGAALLVTVIVGNLLKIWLDEEALKTLTTGENTDPPADVLYDAPVRDVQAFSYVFGNDLADYLETPSVSLSINTPAGDITYTSDIVSYFSLPTYRTPPLHESMGELRSVASYVSGVFYPQAFKASSADLRYAETLVESALLREFLQAGGSDILLCDLPLESTGIGAILEYLTAVKRAAGTSPVGVSIPWSLLKDHTFGKTLEQLLTVCDFLALDLRNQTVPLEDCTYYLTQYDMRLLYCSSDTEQIDLARPNIPNLQTVTKPPLPPAQEEPEEN